MLEKAGFRREGLLRSYLRINGIWQDHYLYALIADDQARRPKRRADSLTNFHCGAGSLFWLCPCGNRDDFATSRRVADRADQDFPRRRRARPVRRRRDLPQSGRKFPGFDRARAGRHRPAHRGRGQRPALERRLGGVRARQHHRRAARPADRGAAFPAGRFRPVLARPRRHAHRRDHAERRLCARPAAEPGRRRLP